MMTGCLYRHRKGTVPTSTLVTSAPHPSFISVISHPRMSIPLNTSIKSIDGSWLAQWLKRSLLLRHRQH